MSEVSLAVLHLINRDDPVVEVRVGAYAIAEISKPKGSGTVIEVLPGVPDPWIVTWDELKRIVDQAEGALDQLETTGGKQLSVRAFQRLARETKNNLQERGDD